MEFFINLAFWGDVCIYVCICICTRTYHLIYFYCDIQGERGPPGQGTPTPPPCATFNSRPPGFFLSLAVLLLLLLRVNFSQCELIMKHEYLCIVLTEPSIVSDIKILHFRKKPGCWGGFFWSSAPPCMYVCIYLVSDLSACSTVCIVHMHYTYIYTYHRHSERVSAEKKNRTIHNKSIVLFVSVGYTLL